MDDGLIKHDTNSYKKYINNLYYSICILNFYNIILTNLIIICSFTPLLHPMRILSDKKSRKKFKATL